MSNPRVCCGCGGLCDSGEPCPMAEGCACRRASTPSPSEPAIPQPPADLSDDFTLVGFVRSAAPHPCGHSGMVLHIGGAPGVCWVCRAPVPDCGPVFSQPPADRAAPPACEHSTAACIATDPHQPEDCYGVDGRPTLRPPADREEVRPPTSEAAEVLALLDRVERVGVAPGVGTSYPNRSRIGRARAAVERMAADNARRSEERDEAARLSHQYRNERDALKARLAADVAQLTEERDALRQRADAAEAVIGDIADALGPGRANMANSGVVASVKSMLAALYDAENTTACVCGHMGSQHEEEEGTGAARECTVDGCACRQFGNVQMALAAARAEVQALLEAGEMMRDQLENVGEPTFDENAQSHALQRWLSTEPVQRLLATGTGSAT